LAPRIASGDFEAISKASSRAAASGSSESEVTTPSDAAYVLERTDAVGFVGASSMERLPVESALTATMREFKSVRPRRAGKGPG